MFELYIHRLLISVVKSLDKYKTFIRNKLDKFFERRVNIENPFIYFRFPIIVILVS